MNYTQFKKIVWEYYYAHGRDLPWRQPEPDGTFDPYKIMVSEIMLQQTQVTRVMPKYVTFLQAFPDIQTLATAPLSDVLIAWNGLGYNRRAKYLHEAAKQLADKAKPWKLTDLTDCKGIGHNTAAAVMVYAYNQPFIFIETNIRTVYIHHFFPVNVPAATGSHPIADKEMETLIRNTIDAKRPREWYWALMDYGSYLKAHADNASVRSRHYTKQSVFEGSRRQVRGQVLKLLTHQNLSLAQFQQHIIDERLSQVLLQLETEQLINKQNNVYSLAI